MNKSLFNGIISFIFMGLFCVSFLVFLFNIIFQKEICFYFTDQEIIQIEKYKLVQKQANSKSLLIKNIAYYVEWDNSIEIVEKGGDIDYYYDGTEIEYIKVPKSLNSCVILLGNDEERKIQVKSFLENHLNVGEHPNLGFLYLNSVHKVPIGTKLKKSTKTHQLLANLEKISNWILPLPFILFVILLIIGTPYELFIFFFILGLIILMIKIWLFLFRL